MRYDPETDMVCGEGDLLCVTKVRPLRLYFLELQFSDGTRKTVDVEPLLWGVHEVLRDRDLFMQARLENNTVYWDFDRGPGRIQGLDFAPEALYGLSEAEPA